MVVVGLIASQWENIMNRWDRWTRPAAKGAAAESSDIEYFCPMHPNIVQATEGTCPICGMPLSREKTDAAARRKRGAGQSTSSRRGWADRHQSYRIPDAARDSRSASSITITKVVGLRGRRAVDKLGTTGQRVNKGDPLY
jgi:hypothetical protein